MEIEILISTIDAGIEKVATVLMPPRNDVTYKIIHQITYSGKRYLPYALRRDDVKVYYLNGKGLSKSRNKAIEIASSDIAIIADDDVTYSDEYIENVKKTYLSNPDLDVACFKIKVPDSEEPYKWYYSEKLRLEHNSPHYISSVEITFKPNRLIERDIKFDTRFGLGSGYLKSGEENLFIEDCIQAKLNVWYFPLYITNHSLESSAKNKGEFSKEQGNVLGAIYYRLHGAKGLHKIFTHVRHLRGKKILNNQLLAKYLLYLLQGFIYLHFRRK